VGRNAIFGSRDALLRSKDALDAPSHEGACDYLHAEALALENQSPVDEASANHPVGARDAMARVDSFA
jgi:hypothetical protein